MGGVFAGIGGIIWLIFTVLAILTPVMVYLIQRNTCQTRDELRKLNDSINTLSRQLAAQNQPNKPTKKEKEPPATTGMTCEHCGKSFKYGINHSGTYKPCPDCKKKILLK